MEEEEVVLLEEQLAAAHADLERVQARLAGSEERLKSIESENGDLRRQLGATRQSLDDREQVLTTQASEIETLRVSLGESSARAAAAATRFREALLSAEPDLPADLVQGDTVEAIEAAAEQARQTVARVRRHLEEQAQALRVPAGAPARGGQDTSSLSAAEKIRLGLQGK